VIQISKVQAHLESLIVQLILRIRNQPRPHYLRRAKVSLVRWQGAKRGKLCSSGKDASKKKLIGSLYTDYGTFETQTLNGFWDGGLEHVALCPGVELLEEIAFC